MVKRIWMSLICLVAILLLAACGDSSNTSDPAAAVSKQAAGDANTVKATAHNLSDVQTNGSYYTLIQQSAPALLVAYDKRTHAPLGSVDLSALSGYTTVSHMIGSPDGKRLYLMLVGDNSSTNNTLVTIDTSTRAVIRTTPYISTYFSALGQTELIVSPDSSKLLLVDFYGTQLHVLDAATGIETETIKLPAWSQKPDFGLAMSQADSDSVYLMASNSNSTAMFLHKISLSSGSVVRSYDLAFGTISGTYRSNNFNHPTISSDGTTAYFVHTRGFMDPQPNLPNISMLDLSSGVVTAAPAPLANDVANNWQATQDGKIFFTVNTGADLTFVLYDPATNTRTTIGVPGWDQSCGLTTVATAPPYFDSASNSVFYLLNSRELMQMKADGSSQVVDMGAATLTLGTSSSPLWFSYAVTL